MMNQEDTEKDTSNPSVEGQEVANEIDFHNVLHSLVDHHGDEEQVEKQQKQPGGGHLAVGENLEKVKSTVIEKAGEVKTTIVEKAVEVRKSIDQLLHSSTTTTSAKEESSTANQNLDSSNQDEREHKTSMGEKLESVKTAVAHKAEVVGSNLVLTAEELQNRLSDMFHHNSNDDDTNDDHHGQEKAVEVKTTTERGTDEEEESLDNKENSNNKIGAACSWIVHKVDDLVERVQAHDEHQIHEGETTRPLSRDLVEIISQDEAKRQETQKDHVTLEEKVDQTRSVTSDHA